MKGTGKFYVYIETAYGRVIEEAGTYFKAYHLWKAAVAYGHVACIGEHMVAA